MAYTKTNWVDQEGQVKYTETEDGGYKIFTPNFEDVDVLGTPVDAVHLNNIENGIDGVAIRKYNQTETFNKDELVLGGSTGKEKIYRSLVANNTGNAITDTTKWKKARIGAGRNIGELVYSSLPLTDEGLHLADGTLVSNLDYADFVTKIASLYTQGLHDVALYAYIHGTNKYCYIKADAPEVGTIVYDRDNNIIGYIDRIVTTTSFWVTFNDETRQSYSRFSAFDTEIQESYNCFATETTWQEEYTTYGECGKYVYDSESNTVRLPLYSS